MSVTVAQRPRVHLPWKSIAIFLGAAAIAALALVMMSQPWETHQQAAPIAASVDNAATVQETAPGHHSKTHPLARPGTALVWLESGSDAKTRTMLLSPAGPKKAGVAAGSNVGASR